MNGLLSHEFFEPGIFYYSDQTLTEAAGYFGTIIVKPKVVERFIELTPEGFHEGQAFWSLTLLSTSRLHSFFWVV